MKDLYDKKIQTSAEKMAEIKRQERIDWLESKEFLRRKGGKYRADNGSTYMLYNGVIYQFESDQGISSLLVIDGDGRITGHPLTAELTVDMQFVRPENRGKFLQELFKEEMAHKDRPKVNPKPDVTKKPVPKMKLNPRGKVIWIKDDDWLSKITKERWGSINWQKYLEPTNTTLEARKKQRKPFDPNLIYKGDSFNVKHF